jgi:hypothetical protein
VFQGGVKTRKKHFLSSVLAMRFRWAACISLSLFHVTAALDAPEVSNDLIKLSFSNATGYPLNFLGPLNGQNRVAVDEPQNSPLWSVQYVTKKTKTPLTITSADLASQSFISQNNSLTLMWSGIKLRADGIVDVNLTITLLRGSPFSQWRLSVANKNPIASVGLWTVRLGVGGLKVAPDSSIFYPTGFGTLYSNPAVSLPSGLSRTYPSSNACMQHMAIGGEGSGRQSDAAGVYFAAHDGLGRQKEMFMQVTKATDHPAVGLNGHTPASFDEDDATPLDLLAPPLLAVDSRSASELGGPTAYTSMGVVMYPEKMGQQWTQYDQPHDVAVGLLGLAKVGEGVGGGVGGGVGDNLHTSSEYGSSGAAADAPPPGYSSPFAQSYLADCPNGSIGGCPKFSTLAAAASACDQLPTCGGITSKASDVFELRLGIEPVSSQDNEQSWLRSAAVHNRSDIWYSASEQYREWAMGGGPHAAPAGASWVSGGPIIDRQDDFPAWFVVSKL